MKLQSAIFIGLALVSVWHLWSAVKLASSPRNLDSPALDMESLVRQIEDAISSKGDEAAGVVDNKEQLPMHHSYAALCSIFKNEHGNIREWVQYHHWIGIGKFYIFDHGSTPPLSVELADFVREGLVEVFYFAGNSWKLDGSRYESTARQHLSPQAWAYDNCFRWFGPRHTFIGMLDADEYIVLLDQGGKRGGIVDLLRPFESEGGLVMSWRMVGPSGLVHKPHAPTMTSYTQCIPRASMESMEDFERNPGGYTKSFTRTSHYFNGCNPHHCALDGTKYRNEDGRTMDFTEIHWSRVAVFHFVTRSVEEYHLKLERGSGHTQFAPQAAKLKQKGRGWSYFLLLNDLATEECLEGKRAYQQCIIEGFCTG